MVKKVTKKATRKAGTSKRPASNGAKVNVQSASSLGILASKLGVKKAASTHKGRKILEKRAP